MDEPAGIGKVLRDITQAYAEGLSTIGRAIGDLGVRRIPESERQIERWIGLARMAKDGYVAAIDQGFVMWERRIRRMLAPSEPSRRKAETEASASPIEAWVENWRKANAAFTESILSGELSEQARKQAEEFRKTLETGLKALQKLWQSGSTTD